MRKTESEKKCDTFGVILDTFSCGDRSKIKFIEDP